MTFSGSAVEGNVPILTVDSAGLTGSGVRVDVAELTAGNEPTGRFMLQADTAPGGWPEHRSGWIYVGSTATEVEQAVTQITGVLAADVTVGATLPSIGPIAWEITFSHRLQQEVAGIQGDGELDDSVGVGVEIFVSTGQSGDRPPLRVVRAQLSGSGAEAEAETVQDGERAIGGNFELYLQGEKDVALATVSADASAADIRLALEDLGLPGTMDVIRVGPLDDSLAYTWMVTLSEGTSLWGADGSEDLVADASQLTGEGGLSVETSLVQAGAAPVGGDFRVSLDGGGSWVSLAHNATENEVAEAISSFSASGGHVSVSSEDILEDDTSLPSGSVATGKRWEVTFSALAAAGDVSAIDVDGSLGLLTGAGVDVSVSETSKGVSADIQQVTIDGYSGAFAFFDDGTSSTSSPVPWNATSSEVAEALLEATGKRVYVERTPLSSSATPNSGGHTWLVLFAEALTGTSGNVVLITTDLVPNNDLLIGSSQQADLTPVRSSTAIIGGGGFSLKFGQSCDERASGVYCEVAETQQLLLDSSPDEVKAALEALPAITEVDVSTAGFDDNVGSGFWEDGVGNIAPDGFGVAAAGARFRVTFVGVALNASDSALAEYWRRTWTPENSATEWSGDLATGGDLPPLVVDVSGVSGSHAAASTEETTKGLSTEVGGVVALEVSQNAGRDYTTSGVTYVYEALVSVHALVPNHGPIFGGTEVWFDDEPDSKRSVCVRKTSRLW